MFTSPESPAKDAVAYHRELAVGWEQRYEKPAFKARLRAFEACLAGHDLHGRDWLDAGCGSGTMARYLAAAGVHLFGVDAAEEMIAMARALAPQVVGNEDEHSPHLRFEHSATIAHLPLADQSLDGILCSSVLEYVAEDRGLLRKIADAQAGAHRLGQLLGQRWCAFLDYSRNEYEAADFRALLKQHGFATSKVIPFGSPIPHWLQRREFGGSLLAFCAVGE